MIIVLRKKKKQAIPSRSLNKKFESFKKSKFVSKSTDLSPVNIELLAKKIEHEPALIRIGKNGISEPIISELKRLIPIKKAVKIKILQNAPITDSKEFFVNLETKIGFKLWRKKGNTAIFIYKRIGK